MQEIEKKSWGSDFEQVSFTVLVITLILGILSFAPQSFLSLASVKTVIIGFGTLTSAILFFISKMKEKSFGFSSHPIIWAGFGAAVVTLLASVFSPNFMSSFMGTNASQDTGAFILVLFVAGGLSFIFSRGHENRTFSVFFAILGSFALLALFHVIRFFAGANFLSFGVFTSLVSTPIGLWHDLGVFAGVALIISMVTIRLLPITNAVAKAFFIVVFAAAAILLFIIDLQSVLIVVGITALAFCAYEYIIVRREETHHKKMPLSVPLLSFIVAVAAFLIAWSPGFIGTFMTNDVVTKIGATYTEVNLPWNLTEEVIVPSLKSSPILGAGPARFVNDYLKYKPEEVNSTQFWASDFSNGNSFFSTLAVTQGILGVALWLILMVLFFGYGAHMLLSKKEMSDNPFRHYGLVASYFGVLLLWISLFTYMPSHVILLILFVVSGVLAGHLVSKLRKEADFSSGPARSTVIVILWILVAAAAGFIFVFTKDTVAQIYFEKAVSTLNSGGPLSVSAQDIQNALKYHQSDVYYQTISQMDIYAVNEIIASATTTPSQSTINLVMGLLYDGINSARLAQKFDPTNPYNFTTEAQVAELAAGIGINGGYADATSSYEKSLTLDPLNPSTYLALAKIDFFEKDYTGSENQLSTALELKPNYTDALFEVGIILYEQGNYATALKAFEQVQALQSDYPNIASAISLVEKAISGGGASTASISAVAAPAAASSAATATSSAFLTAKQEAMMLKKK